MRYWLLLALLLVGIHSQAENDVLYYSNISSTVFVQAAEDSSFATRFNVPDPSPDYSASASKLDFKYTSIRREATWVFTDGKANFIKAQKIFPVGWFVKHKLCICSYCPTGMATIYIIGSGFFVLTDSAGNVISSGHVFNTVKKVSIKLNCGCDNTFYLYMFNHFPGPLGVSYYVQQPNQANCYSCKNAAIAFYNTKTCKCECVTDCPCKLPQKWFDYPSCSCMCEKSLPCNLKNQFFDPKKCDCNCRPICCPPWQTQSPTTCACKNIAAASLREQDVCVEEFCSFPSSWSQQLCSCI